MKVQLYTEPSEEGNIRQYFESETALENVDLIMMIKQTKKPNQAYGAIRKDGLMWAWFFYPARKISGYQALKIEAQ